MIHRLKRYGMTLLFVGMLYACIEPYDPPLKEKDINHLVVDGFLNGSNGAVTVRLTRTLPVKSEGPVRAEEDALVYVEDIEGALQPLAQDEPGRYTGILSNLNPQSSYRLIVRTDDEHEYASTFITIAKAPPIDSITWSVHRDGIQFEVNTHDETGETRYFKWRLTATFEYHSRLNSAFMFESPGVVIPRPPEMSLRDCWKTTESTGIIIGSTKHLQQSILSKFPVTLIPYGSAALTDRYSLLVEQQGVSEETYNYWRDLERSTEHLGGLFDPLPSETTGNLTCIHHKDEKALGIFSASTLSEMRIFLSRSELPREQAQRFVDRSVCQPDTIYMRDLLNVAASTLLVDAVYAMSPSPIGYTTGPPGCIDCTQSGGTTTEPPFWR